VTFRRRIALLAGASFAVAVLAVSLVGYVVVRDQLRSRIDDDLTQRVQEQRGLPAELLRNEGYGSSARYEGSGFRKPYPSSRGRDERHSEPLPTDVAYQVVLADGSAVIPEGADVSLPIDEADRALTSAVEGSTRLRDVAIEGARYRMISATRPNNTVLQIARPLNEVDTTLNRFATSSVLVSIAGSALATVVGWFVARRAARPVTELTRAAEHVAETLTFDVGLEAKHRDEIGRLTTSISAMLAALRSSREQQRRLVLDASHELRTPLTSLRTNLSMLDHPGVDAQSRAEIIRDLRDELSSLTDLSTELVELATDTARSEDPAWVDMVELADRVAARARRRSGQAVEVQSEAWTAWGRPGQLERALSNLVDNACKFNPRPAPIEVLVRPGEVQVRDHGPGVAPGDRERVFERFYRADAARSTPGSGLGLAIVAQIVEAHHGRVWVEDPPGGGACFRVTLPTPDTPDSFKP
jgi:two-component system sensor histidine kinase MprB